MYENNVCCKVVATLLHFLCYFFCRTIVYEMFVNEEAICWDSCIHPNLVSGLK